MSRREVILRNILSTRLLEQGFNVFLPVFDEGIDLIAHREGDDALRLIQQKSRWGIFHKYMGRNLWLAFPDRDDWYLVPHDDMTAWPEVTGYMDTASWRERGQYHIARMPGALAQRCAPWKL